LHLRRFFVAELSTQDEFELPRALAHRVARVLRLKVADTFELVTQRGSTHLVEITRLTADRVFARAVGDVSLVEPADEDSVAIYQCVPKGRKLDQLVQDCTELGATRVVAVFSERTVAHWEPTKTAPRLRRLRAIAVHAAEQSRRPAPPVIDGPLSFAQAAERRPDRRQLVLAPGASSRRLGAFVATLTGPVDLLVGPEGGLSDAESALVDANGWTAVSLGPRVVRTETAAVAALAIILDRWEQ